jgi:mannosyltransferase OCH1-like enzyme
MSIPKIVHQIWIGPKKRPDIWMDEVRSFCNKYDYEYVLWDDAKVSEFMLINQQHYEAEKTFNGKSDILRYEILYRQGGIYIDADMAVTNHEKLNTLITEFDKDAGFGFEIDNVLICGAVTLAIKGSEFIRKCIEEIPKRDMSKLAWQSVGPQLITDLWMKYKTVIPCKVYKSKVFYPIRWHGIQDIDLHKKLVMPPESVMFQYGYSTNNLETKI